MLGEGYNCIVLLPMKRAKLKSGWNLRGQLFPATAACPILRAGTQCLLVSRARASRSSRDIEIQLYFSMLPRHNYAVLAEGLCRLYVRSQIQHDLRIFIRRQATLVTVNWFDCNLLSTSMHACTPSSLQIQQLHAICHCDKPSQNTSARSMPATMSHSMLQEHRDSSVQIS